MFPTPQGGVFPLSGGPPPPVFFPPADGFFSGWPPKFPRGRGVLWPSPPSCSPAPCARVLSPTTAGVASPKTPCFSWDKTKPFVVLGMKRRPKKRKESQLCVWGPQPPKSPQLDMCAPRGFGLGKKHQMGALFFLHQRPRAFLLNLEIWKTSRAQPADPKEGNEPKFGK